MEKKTNRKLTEFAKIGGAAACFLVAALFVCVATAQAKPTDFEQGSFVFKVSDVKMPIEEAEAKIEEAQEEEQERIEAEEAAKKAAEEEAARIAAEEAAEAEAEQQNYYQEPVYYAPVQNTPYQGNSFKSDGVWYDDSYRYTWYSSNVLYHYRTDEWTAGSDGIYRDSEGYVVVASSDLPQGTVVEDTPFGAAKVYDSGCASGTLDVYTNF